MKWNFLESFQFSVMLPTASPYTSPRAGWAHRRVDHSGSGADTALLTTVPTGERRNHQIPHQLPLGQVSTKRDARGGTLTSHETTGLEEADEPTRVSSRSPAMSRGRKTHETQDNITPHGNHANPQRKRERVLQMVHETMGGSLSPEGLHSQHWPPRPTFQVSSCRTPSVDIVWLQGRHWSYPDLVSTDRKSAQGLHEPMSVTKTLSTEKQKTEGQRRHNQYSAIPPE